MTSVVSMSYAIVVALCVALTAAASAAGFPQPQAEPELRSPASESLLTKSELEDTEETNVKNYRYHSDLLIADQSDQESGFVVDRRKAVRSEQRRWPDAVIPYEFHSSVENISHSARSLIRRAMDYWESQTCLRFIPFNPDTDKDYIIIMKAPWCSSVVGRRGGAQTLKLASGCLKFGSVVHELGHATGFIHEHARPDRDEYIEIVWSNVDSEDARELEKQSDSLINTYDIPYDYSSIMHYNGTTGKIRALDPTKQKLMGQRERLSFYDVKLSNIMYKCAERNKCDLKAVTCRSEGYVGPKCTCVCPDGTDSCSMKKGVPKATSVTARSRSDVNGKYYIPKISRWTEWR